MGLSLDEIRELPADVLAYRLLPELPARGAFSRTTWITGLLSRLANPGVPGVFTFRLESHWDEGVALAAALERLVQDGVLVPFPSHDPAYPSETGDMLSITAWGARQRTNGDARQIAAARRRVSLELHAELQPTLTDLLAVGAFESAALDALRMIEARVRRLIGDPKSGKGHRLTGVPLMEQAFGSGGLLTDPSADTGEQQGVMNLFKGAFGAVRNVLAHTDEKPWSDSAEAAEYVLLADLLMRRLDAVERRLAVDAARKTSD